MTHIKEPWPIAFKISKEDRRRFHEAMMDPGPFFKIKKSREKKALGEE